MPSEKLVYWDSDVFISRIQRDPPRIQVLERITAAAQRGEVRIVTSILAMAETAFFKHPVLLPEEQEQLIVDFFENPYITVVPLDTWVCAETRKLVRKHHGSKIRAADLIHVATALHVRVRVLNSYDEGMLKLNGQVEGLRIEEPTFAGDFPLLPDVTDVV